MSRIRSRRVGNRTAFPTMAPAVEKAVGRFPPYATDAGDAS